MREQCMNIIEISWTKPIFSISDVYSDKLDLLQIPDKQNVLYQIYGASPIYGHETLLYIGQTINSIRRIQEHLEFSFNRIINFSIRIGEFDFKQDNVKDTLDISETILIAMLKPSYNAQNIKNISSKAKDNPYLILNKGNRGLIPQEISNIWWF